MKTRSILIIFGILIALIIMQSIKYKNLNQKYDIAVQNNKAYESQLEVSQEENKVFQFTIEQLQYINDSSLRSLDSLRHEIGIRDKKIKQMGKVKEYVYITDTVKVNDTIFCDENFKLDTTLGDKWYKNNLHMQYPNIISSTIQVNTDQSCFLHTSRETINPPKKTWLGRLFQKKHDVYNITVIEANPYITVKENKFVIVND